MVLVSVSIHEARVSSTFFGGLKASRIIIEQQQQQQIDW